ARSNLLTLQDQIAQAVAEALKVQMTAAERERLFRRYTENAAAYERYLKGRAEFHAYTAQSVRASIVAFEEALKLDPDYALARAGVALSSAIMRLRFAPTPEHPTWTGGPGSPEPGSAGGGGARGARGGVSGGGLRLGQDARGKPAGAGAQSQSR